LFAKVIHDFYHILRLIPLTAPERKMMLWLISSTFLFIFSNHVTPFQNHPFCCAIKIN
jgi:hypothetical protein